MGKHYFFGFFTPTMAIGFYSPITHSTWSEGEKFNTLRNWVIKEPQKLDDPKTWDN